MTRLTLIVGCLVLTAAATTAQDWFLPTVEVARSALHTLDGPNPRYQASYVLDRYATEETCVLIITDTMTGRFAITAVAPASCLVREAATAAPPMAGVR